MDASDKSRVWASGPHGSLYGGRRASGGKTRLLIVDDHDGFRQALIKSFNLEPDIEVVGEATNGQAAIEETGRLRPDLVLMDVNMPGINGLEATRKITDTYTGVLVIILTMHTGEEHMREARRAGASAYVVKDSGSEILLKVIRDVMRGETPLLQSDLDSPTPTPSLPASQPAGSGSPPTRGPATAYLITSNERAILGLLADGLTNDEIARQLNLQLYMVRTYIGEICRKLGLADLDAVVEYARTHHFDDPSR